MYSDVSALIHFTEAIWCSSSVSVSSAWRADSSLSGHASYVTNLPTFTLCCSLAQPPLCTPASVCWDTQSILHNTCRPSMFGTKTGYANGRWIDSTLSYNPECYVRLKSITFKNQYCGSPPFRNHLNRRLQYIKTGFTGYIEYPA
jgi:hypothetical protein